MTPGRLGLLFAGVALFASVLACAEEPKSVATPVPVLDRFRLVGSCESPVREISGAVVLPGATDREGTLLVVSDEGRWFGSRRTVEGALYRLPYRIAADDSRVEVGEGTEVVVATGDRLPPPAETGGADHGTAVDWEGLAALPGTTDLFLVSAERDAQPPNPPANRAYVVRHARDGTGTTALLGVLALPALPADGENDRFEGVAVLPAVPAAANRWRVWFFKERTTPGGDVPVVLPTTLVRDGDHFRLDPAPAAADAFRLAEVATDVATQADAVGAADGSVWVLDHWQRRLQHVRPEAARPLRLAREEAIDLWEVVKTVGGETLPLGTPPPGRADLVGYGLHEAITFDAAGRLFLAADRSERMTSVVTVLVPRPPR